MIPNHNSTKNTPKHKGNFIKTIGILVFFVTLVFVSEFIFQVRLNPRPNAYSFFRNAKVLDENQFLAKPYNFILANSLYFYLSAIDYATPNERPCFPLCLSYEEGQNILHIYKKLLSTQTISSLTKNQRANFYFWMSTLNIWHDDDITTIGWLEKGLKDKEEKLYEEFYEVLKNIDNFNFDSKEAKGISEKIDSADENTYLFQQVYLAKAAHKFGLYYLEQGDLSRAEGYLKKSLELNGYNVDYYLTISEVYILQNNIPQAFESLERCISKIAKDSGACKEKLLSLSNKAFNK